MQTEPLKLEEVFPQLCETLAHKLRSPLSVVSNELTVLAGDDPESVAISQRKIRELASTLSDLVLFSAAPMKALVPFTELFKEFSILAPSGEYLADKNQLVRSLGRLRELLRKLDGDRQFVECGYEDGILSMRLLNLPAAESLSALFSNDGRLLFWEVPLLEQVLLNHQIVIDVQENVLALQFCGEIVS